MPEPYRGEASPIQVGVGNLGFALAWPAARQLVLGAGGVPEERFEGFDPGCPFGAALLVVLRKRAVKVLLRSEKPVRIVDVKSGTLSGPRNPFGRAVRAVPD